MFYITDRNEGYYIVSLSTEILKNLENRSN